MPTALLDGQAIFYTQPLASQGLPLVLLHGAGGTHLNWPPQLRRMRRRPVLAVDLPGHGKSGAAGRDTIAAYAQAVLAVLDTLAVPRAVVAGHSLGGAIGQLLALQHPERLAGLILVSTGARLAVAPEILDGVLEDFPRAVDLIIHRAYASDAPQALKRLTRKRMLAVSPAVLHGDFAACDAFDVRDTIGSWTGPTLVLVGAADRMTPLKFSQYLAQQIAGAHLQVLPGAGHMLILERPVETTAALEAFVQQIEAS